MQQQHKYRHAVCVSCISLRCNSHTSSNAAGIAILVWSMMYNRKKTSYRPSSLTEFVPLKPQKGSKTIRIFMWQMAFRHFAGFFAQLLTCVCLHCACLSTDPMARRTIGLLAVSASAFSVCRSTERPLPVTTTLFRVLGDRSGGGHGYVNTKMALIRSWLRSCNRTARLIVITLVVTQQQYLNFMGNISAVVPSASGKRRNY